ncbi:hypothetical protein [Streptomyces sp. NPDC058847]|uniref:hypothetical protein n=1 Tax=Streptomyces sp. NPDC058847 TaxID=3346649 RepID=UPI003674E113
MNPDAPPAGEPGPRGPRGTPKGVGGLTTARTRAGAEGRRAGPAAKLSPRTRAE